MNDDDKKHFDIARPGGAPASHTSRPIIVGRQQLTHDPMMRTMNDAPENADDKVEKPAEAPVEPHHEQTITPPEASAEPEHDKPSGPAIEAPAPSHLPTATLEKAPEDKELPASVVESKDNPEPVQPPDKTQELIDKKTYNLPIHQAKSRKLLTILIVVGLVLLVAGTTAVYFLMNR